MAECWGGKWLPARAVQIVAEAPSKGETVHMSFPPTADSHREVQEQGFFVID